MMTTPDPDMSTSPKFQPCFKPWVGFDFDRTLVYYDKWKGAGHIGTNIPAMVELLQDYLKAGKTVKIFTARIHPILEVDEKGFVNINTPVAEVWELADSRIAVDAIRRWSIDTFGMALRISCVKDLRMDRLYDDRAVEVIPNTGLGLGGKKLRVTD